jgi:hypothetical protein
MEHIPGRGSHGHNLSAGFKLSQFVGLNSLVGRNWFDIVTVITAVVVIQEVGMQTTRRSSWSVYHLTRGADLNMAD